jgi:hypothetical protein
VCAAQSPQHDHSGQGSGRGRQFAAVQHIAFLARFFAAVLGCLFGALSGHRLSSRQDRPAGHGDQPLGQVEQAREARLDKARPQGQRAGQKSKAGQGFQGHGQVHHRQLRTELAQQGHGHLDQHGCRQHRRGQLDRGQKDAAGGAHDASAVTGASA